MSSIPLTAPFHRTTGESVLAHPHRRALLGIVAGTAATALFATTLGIPAVAGPVSDNGKFKLADAANQSRVIKGRYLVETTGTPLAVGGSKSVNQARQSAAESAVRSVGAKVGTTYSDLWTGMAVTATDEQITQLARSSSVSAIYPVLRVPMPKTTVSKTKVSSELSTISAAATGYTGKGIRVGIIDTGIDYNNRDFGGSGTNNQTKDFGPTAPRVKYGYDFVGDQYDADDVKPVIKKDAYPDDCAGHGTHVAGIVGANGDLDTGGARGVAPQVTFGAYRVFGCAGSTDTQVIIDAMTRAKKDGMNVVNMSLGSTFDSWPSYPDAVAAANLVKAGIVVVASAGNDGDLGLFAAGSPAVGPGVISVASYESVKIKTRAISVNDAKYPYTAVEGTATAPVSGNISLQLASNTTACTVPDSATGSALLIKRGDCSFSQKVANAVTAGAAAVVIYNNVPGMDSFTTEPQSYSIPAISIGGTDGENLASLIGTGSQQMTWLNFQPELTNPDGGALSTFSSAGLAADLSLVPTITAPGGKIYSTLPVEQGSHGNMSGTSMASPYVAGSAAVLLQAKSSLKKKPASVAQLLYNTADPVSKATETGVTNHAEAVFRQGSGLVNLAGALGATVTASPSVLKLGEGTSRTVTVKLTNKTKATQVYTPSVVTGVSAAASVGTGVGVGTSTPTYAYGPAGFKASPSSIKVKASKTVKVKLKLTAPSVLPGRAGLLYGGWVKFTSAGTGNTVTVPFAGVRGDYQAVKLLNGFKLPVSETESWSLPTLSYVDQDGYLQAQTAPGRGYSMDPDTYDVPIVLYHLDYPASDVQLRVTNTATRKSYDAIINLKYVKGSKASSKSTHLYKQSRDDSFQELDFFGAYYSKGKVKWVPSGSYTLQLRVLKPLGSAKKSSHWETFTTPKFTISWYDE
jgi:subtilisin family serine protease